MSRGTPCARLCPAVVLALALALPVAQASAAPQTLEVAPGSARQMTPCTHATPCEFTYAIGAAQAGDDVLFTAGEYDYVPAGATSTLAVPSGVTLHGTPGQAPPLLRQTGGYHNCSCAFLELGPGDTLRDLSVDQAAPDTGSQGVPAGAVMVPNQGVTIERATLTGVSNGMYFISGSGPPALIRDSVIVAQDGAAVTSQGVTSDTLENVTAIAHGTHGIALRVSSIGGSVNTLNVINTIPRGDLNDVSVTSGATANAQLNAHYSDLRTAQTTMTGPKAGIAEDHMQRGDPVFAGPSDYHELVSSPTIDAGTAGGLTGSMDLAGRSRTLGAAPDIGAYEFTGAAPLVITGAPATVSGSSATLPGNVDAQDLATTYRFVYGPTTAYGSSTVPAQMAAALGANAVSVTVTGLSAGTYHYALTANNSAGSRAGSDQTFTVRAPVVAPVVPSAPALSALGLSSASFRASAGGPSAVAAKHVHAHARLTGTLVSYSDSMPATTTFTVTRTVPGVRSHSTCVGPPHHRHGHPQPCTRAITLGSFTHADTAGANRLRFSGCVQGKRLAPGRYTLTARPVAGMLAGPTRSVRFRIIS